MENISKIETSRKYPDFIFWGLYSTLLLLDSINGFLIEKSLDFPLGQLVKLVLLALIIKYYAVTKSNIQTLALITFYFIFYILHLSLIIECKSVQDSILPMSKFIIAPIGFTLFRRLIIQKPTETYNNVLIIIYINFAILVANVILGLLGLGFSSYSDGDYSQGVRGFFYSINELSGVIILLFGFIVFYSRYYFLGKTKNFLLVVAAILFFTISFGTKTGMGCMLVCVMYSYYVFYNKKKISNRILLYSSIVILLFIIIFLGYKMVVANGLIQRWQYLYNTIDNPYTFLLSGRDLFWEEEKGEYLSSGFLGIIFGLGDWHTVEMDHFDALINYGVIGLIIVYSFWFDLIRRAYKLRKKNVLARFVLLVDLLIVFFSLVAGHLLFSGIMNPFVPIINILMYVPDKLIRQKISFHFKYPRHK